MSSNQYFVNHQPQAPPLATPSHPHDRHHDGQAYFQVLVSLQLLANEEVLLRVREAENLLTERQNALNRLYNELLQEQRRPNAEHNTSVGDRALTERELLMIRARISLEPMPDGTLPSASDVLRRLGFVHLSNRLAVQHHGGHGLEFRK